ncbi:transmembrane protein 225 [Tupaia chinensis]|uniref:transmembrane protein 225 n=1 Tax=Tupaia chinensis TaxID=246437 RepID=UPI0003C9157D|nr:transmembrane protein 225 [Tupaia chinensis]XP_006148889.1 transmembrane protein 225 [Tupaia chinensis]
MVQIWTRNIQALNMFSSSWAVVLLAIGVLMDEWVELTSQTETEIVKKHHSPWMTCCLAIWPEGSLEVVRILMIMVLSFSFFLNLFLGLEFTYMIPRNKYVTLFAAFLGFLSGALMLCAILLYRQKLEKGKSVYFSSYKESWVTATSYLNVFFLFASGILSLLQCKCPTSSCSCLNIHEFARKHGGGKQRRSSIQVISLPQRTEMPRSIIRTHTKEGSLDESQVHTRRVTWAV